MVMRVYRVETVAEKLRRLGRDAGGEAEIGENPQAAVAAILREGEGGEGAELFFIRRAESATDPWSGHIAFPGGRRDAVDASLLATAIRETREEVGIDLTRGELIARLPDVPAFIRSSKRGVLVVTPFVFVVREPVLPTPNREVGGTMWVPLAKLARGEGKGTYAFTWEDKPYELPCIRLDPGQHVLWGMTYRMMETMLEALT
jgi:8-oxo-dGTP pyrophosphatase MutT (NUDIX family)